MKNKYQKYLIQATCIFIIWILILFFILPIWQYNKFAKKYNNPYELTHSKIFRIQTSEKIPILFYSISVEKIKLDNYPNIENLKSLETSIQNMEDYLNNSKNIFIYPNVYELLSNAYFTKYQYTQNESDLSKSHLYTEKLLNYTQYKQSFIYKHNLAKIDIGKTEEGVNKIIDIYSESDKLDIDEYYMGLAKYYIGEKEKSLIHLEKLLSSQSTGKNFIRSWQEIKNIYYNFMQEFYNKKDMGNFFIVVNRLIYLDDNNKEFFIKIIETTDKKILPNIKLEY